MEASLQKKIPEECKGLYFVTALYANHPFFRNDLGEKILALHIWVAAAVAEKNGDDLD